MRFSGIVLAAILTFCFFPAARAEEIKRKGGSAYTARIGPWHIQRTTYEDGATVCWAYNWNYGNRIPTFAYLAARGGDHPVSMMRFDSTRPARANETVTLIVGDEQLKLIHRPGGAKTAFIPETVGDARKITRILEERQRQSPKYFFVVDGRGGKFKFDARSTTKMISNLENNCGYVRH